MRSSSAGLTTSFLPAANSFLSASSRKSDRESSMDFNKNGGFRVDFIDDRLSEKCGHSARFTFSGEPGAYRMHSGLHHNNQLDWVVWNGAVPTNGQWEKMELLWLGGDGDREGGRKTFKIKGYEGFYVKWAVSGFTGVKDCEEATEFILREV